MTDTPADGFRDRPVWILAVIALLIAQAGLALALFGSGRGISALTDDRPILSGRHPLHFYHGVLGAESFRENGTTTCYDPRFQAGFPKTPVFDSGSRPAELFLVLGGTSGPAAYKIGLFAILLMVPIAFVIAARGAGLPPGAAVLTGVGGMLLSWSEPGRRMICEGQLDSFGAGLAAIVFVPWLARFARTLGVDAWLVLAVTALAGWFFHPLVWVGLSPVVFAYYLVFAPRHGPAFHLGLAGITFIGITPNVWWMVDWTKFWWLRRSECATDQLQFPSWDMVLGLPTDYPALFSCFPGGIAVILVSLAGSLVMLRRGHRVAPWLLLFSAAFTVAAARLALVWPGVPYDASERLALLAAGLLAPSIAFAAWAALERFRLESVGVLVAVAVVLAAGWMEGRQRFVASTLGVSAPPLLLGLSAEQRDLIIVLKQHTSANARILWDETTEQLPGWNWSALLPLLTERSFLGGLDPEAGVELSYCGMCERQLTGRNLQDWSDDELDTFCRWYNVGWVVARSPAVIARWAKHPQVHQIARLTEAGRPVVVYAIDRPRSYVLSGTATWESADARRVVLTGVIPNAEGEVQLSLHGIEGMRVFPSYVQIKPLQDPTGRDPVHFIRLRLPGPVPRISLVWEAP